MILRPFAHDEVTDEEFEKLKKLRSTIKKYMEGLKKNLHDARSFDQFLADLDLDLPTYIKVIRAGLEAPEVFLKRAPCDMRTNNYPKNAAHIWDSNMDLQYVLDPYGAVVYLTSYLLKGQRGMSKMLKEIADKCKKDKGTANSVITKLGNHFLNHSAVCAQEATNLIFGNKIKRTTRTCIFIPTGEHNLKLLKHTEQLLQLPSDSTDIFYDDLLLKYAERPPNPEIEATCLADAATWYTINASSPETSVPTPVAELRRRAHETAMRLQNSDINLDDLIPIPNIPHNQPLAGGKKGPTLPTLILNTIFIIFFSSVPPVNLKICTVRIISPLHTLPKPCVHSLKIRSQQGQPPPLSPLTYLLTYSADTLRALTYLLPVSSWANHPRLLR